VAEKRWRVLFTCAVSPRRCSCPHWTASRLPSAACSSVVSGAISTLARFPSAFRVRGSRVPKRCGVSIPSVSATVVPSLVLLCAAASAAAWAAEGRGERQRHAADSGEGRDGTRRRQRSAAHWETDCVTHRRRGRQSCASCSADSFVLCACLECRSAVLNGPQRAVRTERQHASVVCDEQCSCARWFVSVDAHRATACALLSGRTIAQRMVACTLCAIIKAQSKIHARCCPSPLSPSSRDLYCLVLTWLCCLPVCCVCSEEHRSAVLVS
jgi:hypothetical protein